MINEDIKRLQSCNDNMPLSSWYWNEIELILDKMKYKARKHGVLK